MNECLTNNQFQGHLNADISYQTLVFFRTPLLGYIKYIINSAIRICKFNLHLNLQPVGKETDLNRDPPPLFQATWIFLYLCLCQPLPCGLHLGYRFSNLTAHWNRMESRKILMLVSTARESRLESLQVGIFKSPSGDSNVQITG